MAESHHINRIVIDPTNENVVFVAALGHLYSQNPERGLYRTSDGGKTWHQVLKVDEYTGAVDVVVHPKNPKIVIASMWDRDRRAWNFREAGKGSGVFRSVDGGSTWSKITQLPMGDAAGRTGLALSREHPNRVYALVDNQSFDPDWPIADENVPSGRLTPRRFLLLTGEMFTSLDKSVLEPFWRRYGPEDMKFEEAQSQVKEGRLSMDDLRAKIEARDRNAFIPNYVEAEVYRSDDAGATWQKTKLGQLGGIGGYYWGQIEVNPKDPDDVIAMGLPLLRSTDGGATWKRIARRSHVDYHAVWHDPRNPKKVWIGNDGGLYLSLDGGVSVRHINNLPLAQATTLALDNKSPYNVFIGLQDNGTMKGPSNYRPGIDDPERWTAIMGGDGSAIAIDPRDGGDIVYTAFQFGGHMARNQKTNETWSTRAAQPKGDPATRYNWISPLILSSHHPDIVYLGAQRVYRSFNMGRKWEPISPDLTKNLPNGDVPYSTIKDLSESPIRFGLIYAGCDDGSLKMTPDGGHEWIDISTSAKDKWVSRVVASRHEVGTVYVAQSGYREDDITAYLWKSSDFGKTWHSIVGDLPAETINVIREDPWRKDVLYVGTDMGVWMSLNGGKSWESLHTGMPNLPVHDLAIHEREKDLVAATHARGAYILSLKTIDKLTTTVLSTPLTVFPIDNIARSATWGYDRREKWDSTPPRHPSIKVAYYTQFSGPVTVRLTDKNGKLLKETLSTATRGLNEVEIDLLDRPGSPGLANPRERRIVSAQDALQDPYQNDRPTYYPAGEYSIEVVVGGHSVKHSLRITG